MDEQEIEIRVAVLKRRIELMKLEVGYYDKEKSCSTELQQKSPPQESGQDQSLDKIRSTIMRSALEQ